MECAYLFDDDGTQVHIHSIINSYFIKRFYKFTLKMYCTICSAGNEVFMCDTPNCSK